MTTRSQLTQQPTMNVTRFLAAIRRVETGDWDGRYDAIGTRVNGDRPVGAYQILESQWAGLAARAGIPGARWRDPAAQDRVAAQRAADLFSMFGSWDLVALAWVGGTSSVNKVLQRGWEGPKTIHNPQLRQYLDNFQQTLKDMPEMGYEPKPIPYNAAATGTSRGWVNPVAGKSEWSGGSWMPNTLTHRGRTHAAIDMYAKEGTPIVAPVAGKVLSARKSKVGGNTVRVKGDDGIIYYFAHMATAAPVKAGQKIFAGHHIGYVGNSGSAKNTKPHLHFSMQRANGGKINPKPFLEGSVAETGYRIAPMGDAYRDGDAREGVGPMLNKMLSEMSNRVAGGQRDPSVLEPELEDEQEVSFTENDTSLNPEATL